MNIKLSILFICLAMSIFSQEKVDISFSNTSLLEVLKQTETKFGVKFSYNADVIENKTILFSKKNCDLTYLLGELELQTSLNFNKINDRYYYISIKETLNEDDFTLLNEVLVTNYITSGIHKKRNGTITIQPNQVGTLPGLTEPDVLESLKIIPGIQSPDETAAGIYIRGGTPNQNLLLWDGIKTYYSGHFFGMISSFNPFTVKEVTVSKGGTAARYGNRVSGVIDIKTSNKIPKKTTGTFGVNMTHADAFVNIPLSDNTAISFSARRSISDVFKTFTYNKLSTRVFQTFNSNQESNVLDKSIDFDRTNNFVFSDYTAKVIVKPSEKESLSISFLRTENKMFNDFTVKDYNDKYDDYLDIKNTGLSLNWKIQSNEKTKHNVKGYFSTYKLNYNANYGFLNNFITQLSTKNNTLNDIGLSYSFKYNLNNTNNILVGYDYSSTNSFYDLEYSLKMNKETNVISKIFGNTSNDSHSLFAEYLFDNGEWNINTGTRLNYFTKLNKYVIEPRIYIEKKLTPSVSFKSTYELKHQTLSQVMELQTSILGFDLENQIWVQANNDDIPLQKSTQISAGLLFNKNNWKIDIEPYFKKVTGLTTQTSGYFDQSSNFSLGKGRVFGVDVLINKKINNYRTWINYSYTKNEFKILGNSNTYFSANHDLTNYFSWFHAYKHNRYEFSLGWVYRTGVPYTAVKEFNSIDGVPNIVLDFDNINAFRLPSYSRLDGSVTYGFNFSDRWKGKFGISILNILGQKNILQRTYGSYPELNDDLEVENKLQELDKVSLGLTPNLVFRVSF